MEQKEGGDPVEAVPKNGDDLTLRRKILMAAVALSNGEPKTFPVEDLIVRAWQLFPETFSLRGYPHPDSNRVESKLSGHQGLCDLGWLEHCDTRTYRVTDQGLAVAQRLRQGLAPRKTWRSTNEPSFNGGRKCGHCGTAGHRSDSCPNRLKSLQSRPAQVARPMPVPVACGPAMKLVQPAPVAPQQFMELTHGELTVLTFVTRSDALRKFLRGAQVTFVDACTFWGVSTGCSGEAARAKFDAIEKLLTHLVQSYGTDGVNDDPRLPALPVCYGLLNLHRLMLGRFKREIEAAFK